MHPSLLYDVVVREHERRLALEARRHEQVSRESRDPGGEPQRRPGDRRRAAADGHVLAA